jgi:hypothetical protein
MLHGFSVPVAADFSLGPFSRPAAGILPTQLLARKEGVGQCTPSRHCRFAFRQKFKD